MSEFRYCTVPIFGGLTLLTQRCQVVRIAFAGQKNPIPEEHLTSYDAQCCPEVVRELEDYAAGSRRTFSVLEDLVGGPMGGLASQDVRVDASGYDGERDGAAAGEISARGRADRTRARGGAAETRVAIVNGTDFQRQVWRALTAIPYGQTVTYAEVARAIGRPTAVRAVASAIGKNPLGIIIPCHRVIGADGSLTGFAGGLGVKASLLDHEAAHRNPTVAG